MDYYVHQISLDYKFQVYCSLQMTRVDYWFLTDWQAWAFWALMAAYLLLVKKNWSGMQSYWQLTEFSVIDFLSVLMNLHIFDHIWQCILFFFPIA